MSVQITARLPDERAFLDRSVAEGKAPSRAAVVAAALEREMRRRSAEHDAATLRAVGAGDDLDGRVDWSAGRGSGPRIG